MQPKVIEADADVGRRTLCLFMDETGHEEFKSDQRFFAIGGIAGFTPQVEHASRLWRQMKAKHFGGAEMPLHASGKMITRSQIDAVTEFFKRSRLPRFAFIIKRPPVLPSNINALKLLHPLMAEELARMIGDLPTLPSDVLICLEHSERLMPKIIEAMPGVSLQIDDTDVPVVGLFTRKEPPEPLLEMADQLTWRAQRQYKDQAPGKELMPEFVAVFPEGAAYAIYRELRVGTMSGGEEPQWQLSFAEDDRVRVRLEWPGRRTARKA
jgi:hypothetical protein